MPEILHLFMWGERQARRRALLPSGRATGLARHLPGFIPSLQVHVAELPDRALSEPILAGWCVRIYSVE